MSIAFYQHERLHNRIREVAQFKNNWVECVFQHQKGQWLLLSEPHSVHFLVDWKWTSPYWVNSSLQREPLSHSSASTIYLLLAVSTLHKHQQLPFIGRSNVHCLFSFVLQKLLSSLALRIVFWRAYGMTGGRSMSHGHCKRSSELHLHCLCVVPGSTRGPCFLCSRNKQQLLKIWQCYHLGKALRESTKLLWGSLSQACLLACNQGCFKAATFLRAGTSGQGMLHRGTF